MAKSDTIWHTGRVRSTQALKQMERRIEVYPHNPVCSRKEALAHTLILSYQKKNEKGKVPIIEKSQGMGYLDFFPLLDPLGPSSPPPN